ncbi:MAG TPA: hypothetical protein VLD63_04350, partial [Anaerolineales bacterium]|nr:hypothetical protein [Anaerolineales bacterium]
LSRRLTYGVATAYALLGAVLFLWPTALAPVFAWNVTPFMAMTIGGWCLGNAWLAWISARRWTWGLVYSALGYLWLFGFLQAAVVIAFAAKLRLGHPVAWAYLAALALNVLCGLVGVAEIVRARPAAPASGGPVRPLQRATVWAFVVFVGFLALYGLVAPVGAVGTNGGIFPEVMSPFTLRSFAAFYLALALAAGPLVRERSLAVLLHHAFASYGLIVAITAAALFFLPLFDFAHRPGGLVYLGAYFLVGVPLIPAFFRLGTGAPAASDAA